jgi:hypothetical protein
MNIILRCEVFMWCHWCYIYGNSRTPSGHSRTTTELGLVECHEYIHITKGSVRTPKRPSYYTQTPKGQFAPPNVPPFTTPLTKSPSLPLQPLSPRHSFQVLKNSRIWYPLWYWEVLFWTGEREEESDLPWSLWYGQVTERLGYWKGWHDNVVSGFHWCL